MRNLLWRPLAGLAMLSLCCAGMAWGQDDEDTAVAEDLLPPSTKLMFSIEDVPALMERGSESTLGQMLVDPDFQPFLDQLRAKFKEGSEKLQAEIGLTLEDLTNLPQGEITFAIVEEPARRLNAVFMMDYGRNEETMGKLLEMMDKSLTGQGATKKVETISEVEVQVFEFPKKDEIPYNKIAYFTADNYFVIASDPAALKAVLNRWEGDSDDTLATNEVYAYIMEKSSTGDELPPVRWYFDLIGLVKSGVAMVQGQNPQAGLVLGVLPILGLDRLKGMGGGMDLAVEDYDSISKTFIYAEQPPVGVLGLFQFPAIDQAPPKWVPEDATLYMGVNWDLNEAYLAVEAVLDSFQGPGATAKLLDAAAMQDGGPGIHPKKDVMDLLTGHMTIVTTAPEVEEEEDDAAAAIPEFTVTMALKDAEAMRRTLDKASKSDGFPGRVLDVQGHVLYEIPTETAQNLSLAVVGDHLVFTGDKANVETLISGETDAPLASSGAWKAIAKYLPGKTSIVTFSQQDAQMKSVYDLLKQQAQGDFAESGIDLSTLPSYESLAKYSKPAASYAVPDKRGALFVGFTLAD